ncbi:MAG: hypothetical protein IPK84_02525 [Candidatus Moraniibacteriota bacterium]|nr:MAG: hypothetical protein IPK84_02525 [Candidatus Moranbacteria bacterium]
MAITPNGHGNKLGFGRREHQALLEQIDEGMNPCLWYIWTNMLFQDVYLERWEWEWTRDEITGEYRMVYY